MLSHLVYVSNRNENCTNDEIDKILESCKKNNGTCDITGVLLYSERKFVQYLEGDPKEIVGLYDKIKMDRRHSNAIMITLSPILQRYFPSWQMGSKKFNDNQFDFKTKMNLVEKREFQEMLAGTKKEGTRALELMKKFLV